MFELPKEFNPADWDKAKSTADKLKKDTGLGNKLKDLRTSYKSTYIQRIERAFGGDDTPADGLKAVKDWLEPFTFKVEKLQELAALVSQRKDLSDKARTAAHNISESAKEWLAEWEAARMTKELNELQRKADQRMMKALAAERQEQLNKLRKIDLAGALADLDDSLGKIKAEHFMRTTRGRPPLPIDQLRDRAEEAQTRLSAVVHALDQVATLCRTYKVKNADDIKPWATQFNTLAKQYPQTHLWRSDPDDDQDGVAPTDWPRMEKLIKAVQQALKDPLFGKRLDWLD